MEKLTFNTMVDKKKVECEALFVFESEDTGYTYLVYTDHSVDEAGFIRTYAGRRKRNAEVSNERIIIEPIETETEWSMIETIFEELQNNLDEYIE